MSILWCKVFIICLNPANSIVDKVLHAKLENKSVILIFGISNLALYKYVFIHAGLIIH